MSPDESSPKLASVGQRMGNGIVDLVVTVPLAFVVAAVSGLGTTHSYGFVVLVHLRGLSWVVAGGVVFLLFTLLEYATGKTPGKYFTGTCALSLRGDPLSFRASLIRNLLRFVDFFLVGLLGITVILITKHNQRVGDLLAGTSVFRE